MDSLSSNIQIRTVFLSALGSESYHVSCFLSTKKYSILWYLLHVTILDSHYVSVGSLDLRLSNSYKTSSRHSNFRHHQKANCCDIYTVFYQEPFHYRINYKHHLFYIYRLIFQKNLQFLHIQTGNYIILFLKGQ